MHPIKESIRKTISSRHWLWGLTIGAIISVSLLMAALGFYYQQRFYQGLNVDDVYIGGLTYQEALQKLASHSKQSYPPTNISLQHQDQAITLPSQQVILGKNYHQALDRAFAYGHSGSIADRIADIITLLRQPIDITAGYQLNTNHIQEAVSHLKTQVDQVGREPAIVLNSSGQPYSLSFEQGQDGLLLLSTETTDFATEQLMQALNNHNQQQPLNIQIVAQVKNQDNTLDQQQTEQALQRARNFVGQSLTFYSHQIEDDQLPDQPIIKKEVNDTQLIDSLTWPTGIDRNQIKKVVGEWAQEIDQPAINAEFQYEPQSLVVTHFKPHRPGLELNQKQTVNTIVDAINDIDQRIFEEESKKEHSFDLALEKAQPETTLAETNDMGINQQIGFGETYYYHSIPSRIHNVKVTADKLSLTIVPPGEEFSFLEAIGDVTGETGYKPAYVIRNGSTLLEYGGGVCQVSTTTFRALLNAGLDITRRLPHSYRVSYYELNRKPGFDATVYAGNVDLRFVNDTPGYLLIYAQADSNNLYMKVEIYGSDDGRQAEIKNYKKWDYAAPPPAQYIPDPSLAPGQTKQVEHAIPGIKTSFDWVVTNKNGEMIHQKTFYSHYHAWAARYLVGE